MNELAHIALFGFIPLALVFFAFFKPQTAIMATVIVGWLFLPKGSIRFEGFPELNKSYAIAAGALIGLLIFDSKRFFAYRFHWLDLPMLIWVICPIFSALANNLGVYDGLSNILTNLVYWGLPYYIGRIYFRTQEDLTKLAMALFISALVYAPLCLYEIRMSPQLHRMVYGQHALSFVHVMRYGGFRPVVFTYGGLSLGLWLASAALVGLALWRARMIKTWYGVPPWVWCGGICFTMLLSKSTGALMLFFACIMVFVLSRMLRTRILLILIVLTIPGYLALRATNAWDGQELVDYAESVINIKRAESLRTRFENEVALVDRAWMRPAFGWGGWGRARIIDDEGIDISTTDSSWIITLGAYGLIGLGALFTAILLPLVITAMRFGPTVWVNRDMMPLLAMWLVCWMYAIDKLLNATPNQFFNIILGGLMTMAIVAKPVRAAPQSARHDHRGVAVSA